MIVCQAGEQGATPVVGEGVEGGRDVKVGEEGDQIGALGFEGVEIGVAGRGCGGVAEEEGGEDAVT